MNATLGNRLFRLLAGGAVAVIASGALAEERVYFTSDRASSPGKVNTQVFSMNPDGSEVRQHTRDSGVKAYAYRCSQNGPIFFQNDDALALLNGREEEEIYLSTQGTQYHSPRCSSDARYLSVTAWDKANKRGFIEVYDLADKRKVARWEGEEASWALSGHSVIYKLLVRHGATGRIDILNRNLDQPDAAPQVLYRHELGEYVYNITEPRFVGPNPREFVFRVYDEHEYFYYLREVGNSFIRKRGRLPLAHYNVYSKEVAAPLEQGQLTISPDGKFAAFIEHPWNTPPSLYLVDLHTRDSWKIGEGFHPVWAGDSAHLYFNKDPGYYTRYREALTRKREVRGIYPKSLDGYEIYAYDLARKEEKRLTDNLVYDGFL